MIGRNFSVKISENSSEHNAKNSSENSIPLVRNRKKDPCCDKCDVISSYIFAKTTKLILLLSYLVRLDCFSNAFNWWDIALNSYFGRNTKYAWKCIIFIEKLQNRRALKALPQTPLPPAGSLPQTPSLRRMGASPQAPNGLRQPLHWESLATPLLWVCTVAKRLNNICFPCSGFSFRYSFIYQGTSTRRQRSDLFGFRVKLPPVITSLTNNSKVEAISLSALPKNTISELAGLTPH